MDENKQTNKVKQKKKEKKRKEQAREEKTEDGNQICVRNTKKESDMQRRKSGGVVRNRDRLECIERLPAY